MTAPAPSTAPGSDAPFRARVAERMWRGQRELVAAFESMDGGGRFRAHSWERPGGGGGTARVLVDGEVFEKAGVNVSEVEGAEVPGAISDHRPELAGMPFYATGISMVLHPRNPHVPAFHANFRYFELDGGTRWWFGGGADMTPAYGHEEDARHFHGALRAWCDRHDPEWYPRFKAWCDRYFHLAHRDEMRGVGGVFFDDLTPSGAGAWERAFAFVDEGITNLEEAYLPVVERRKGEAWTEEERRWQLHRRSRYAEFNLLYDRGTRFGLETDGNVEAILMSMPPVARWDFDPQVEPGSREAATLAMLQPREWA